MSKKNKDNIYQVGYGIVIGIYGPKIVKINTNTEKPIKLMTLDGAKKKAIDFHKKRIEYIKKLKPGDVINDEQETTLIKLYMDMAEV